MEKKLVIIVKRIWNDPVWSKVISGVILLSPSLISALIAVVKGLSFQEFFNNTITIPVYQFILFCTFLLIMTFVLRWLIITNKNKEKDVSNSELFAQEYELFKTDQTFKHFDEMANTANSRLHFDKFDKDIVNYYVAKNILFDPRPGYGYYILTGKGEEFFRRWAIEKVSKKKFNGS